MTHSGSKRTLWVPSSTMAPPGREDRQCLGVEEVHSGLRQDAERGVVDGLDLVLGENLEGTEGVGYGPPRELVDSNSAPARAAAGPGGPFSPAS